MKQILDNYTSYNLWANIKLTDALRSHESQRFSPLAIGYNDEGDGCYNNTRTDMIVYFKKTKQ